MADGRERNAPYLTHGKPGLEDFDYKNANAALEELDVAPSENAVLRSIIRHAWNPNDSKGAPKTKQPREGIGPGQCFLSVGTLAKDTSLSTRQIKRILQRLERDGFIHIEANYPGRRRIGRGGRAHVVTVLFAESDTKSDTKSDARVTLESDAVSPKSDTMSHERSGNDLVERGESGAGAPRPRRGRSSGIPRQGTEPDAAYMLEAKRIAAEQREEACRGQ